MHKFMLGVRVPTRAGDASLSELSQQDDFRFQEVEAYAEASRIAHAHRAPKGKGKKKEKKKRYISLTIHEVEESELTLPIERKKPVLPPIVVPNEHGDQF